MKGRIYIAGVFNAFARQKCVAGEDWLDNDPHFANNPPTWGICRPDLRNNLNSNDHIFFVSPRLGNFPQMIFAHMRIDRIITHVDAFNDTALRPKRMRFGKNPQGNIIVDSSGGYNPLDMGAHTDRFEKIKQRYAVGKAPFECLGIRKIRRLAPDFMSVLSKVLERSGKRPIDVISRKGAALSEFQIRSLLEWLE